MTTERREFTLRAYLEIIRRQAWIILIVGLIAAAAAYGYSKLQKASYSATAVLNVNDPNSSFAIAGGNGILSVQTPLQLATQAAPLVTRQEVVSAVQRQLGPNASASSVTASVDPNSYVINIVASSHTAGQAAAIANAFATTDAAITTNEVRAVYRSQASAVLRELKRNTKDTNTAYTYSRLQNLATVAQPLTVSSYATPPSSTSSPKTTRNTVAALLLGLLLGIAIATARDALDRRLRYSRDVVKELDHPVIGHISDRALGHSGAPAEASNGVGRLDDADQESFRILRQNITHLGEAGPDGTVLVTSSVAEEGKSTVAACLAVATAEAGKRTLLVECDLRKPVLAKRFHVNSGPGLSDYLTGNAQPHQILQPIAGIIERLNGSGPTIAGSHGGSNLVCITAGTPVHRPSELLGSQKFHDFLAEVSDVYDTVILDTAPLLPVADTLAIVPDVSTVIVCVRLTHTTRDQARSAQAALDRLPQRPVGLVLTNVSQTQDGYYNAYDDALTAA
jgi:capsular exopolysaccharide synthesis family protein